jgi:hypothetical protein
VQVNTPATDVDQLTWRYVGQQPLVFRRRWLGEDVVT